jgi:hypothetical protein
MANCKRIRERQGAGMGWDCIQSTPSHPSIPLCNQVRARRQDSRCDLICFAHGRHRARNKNLPISISCLILGRLFNGC